MQYWRLNLGYTHTRQVLCQLNCVLAQEPVFLNHFLPSTESPQEEAWRFVGSVFFFFFVVLKMEPRTLYVLGKLRAIGHLPSHVYVTSA